MTSILRVLLLAALAVPVAPLAATLDAARELYVERRDAEAQAAFAALVRTDPNNSEAHYYLGRLALRAGDADAAIGHLERAIGSAPRNASYRLELGAAYGAKAQSAGLLGKASLAGKARTELEKAVELDPRHLDARQALMMFYMHAPGILGGGMDKARAQADVIVKLDASRGRSARASIYAKEKRYDEAFALWEEVLRERPSDYGALYQTGRIAAESGHRLGAGIAALRRCLDLTPPAGEPGHAAAHWRIGNILEKQGDAAGARRAYEASLGVDPQFRQAKDSLARLR